MQADTTPDPKPAPDDNPHNHGPQPIAQVMAERGLSAKDLVAASTEQITYKMVQRACKGRRLSPHVMTKIRNALNAATEADYAYADLFNYRAGSSPRA
jgi:hypothetical protein